MTLDATSDRTIALLRDCAHGLVSDIDVKTHGFDVAHRRYNPSIRSTACVRHSADEGDEG